MRLYVSFVTLDPQEGFLGLKNWEQVATSPYFCPTEKCLGKYLAVAVVYGEGFTQATYCDTPVQKVDDELIFEERQKKYCSKKLDADRYRIVSYNLLADLYLNLKQNQTELFFPFCPKQYQSPTYRYPLLLREIDGI